MACDLRVLLATLGVAGVSASAAVPPFTTTLVATERQACFDVSLLDGFTDLSLNDSGAYFIQADTTGAVFNEVLLRAPLTGPPHTPYLAKGIAQSDGSPGTGILSVPSADHAVTSFLQSEITPAGDGILVLQVGESDFGPAVTPTSGVFFNRDAIVVQEGDVSTASGLAPGTTWGTFDGSSQVKGNGSDQVLIVSTVSEDGMDRRTVVVVQTDGSGGLVSETLIAKEGGPVGAGPDTWVSIASGPHASAINNAGDVVFSGTTSAGVSGIFMDDAFVAQAGGPTPVGGLTWGPLEGASVDLNNSGDVVHRGLTVAATSAWSERGGQGGDAGEDPGSRVDQDITLGTGPLTLISGQLADNQDVDLYRIFIDDPATFSATTVPDLGSGFNGANFDSVLWLARTPDEGGRGVVRADDVSNTVRQSTISDALVDVSSTYYLAISTPVARARGADFNGAFEGAGTIFGDVWAADPIDVEEYAGRLYWADHVLGTIRRADTDGNLLGSPIPTGTSINGSIAVFDTGSGVKVYWYDHADSCIRRANANGTTIEDIYCDINFPDGPSAGAVSSLAIHQDGGNSKLYWSRRLNGEINRCNADGTSPELVVSGQYDAQQLVVDSAGGKVYWAVPQESVVRRADLDGANAEDFLTGIEATDLAVDATFLYWSGGFEGGVGRFRLDGTGFAEFITSGSVYGLAVDATNVYWTDWETREIVRASLIARVPQPIRFIGRDIGERVPDGAMFNRSILGWDKEGLVSGPTLNYQIRLTGASFAEPMSMIATNNSEKVAASLDQLAGIAPFSLLRAGSDNGPVWIGDNGAVVWSGLWDAPTLATNGVYTGLFHGEDIILQDVDTFIEPEPAPADGFPGNIIFFRTGTNGFELSPSGDKLLAGVNHFTNYPLTPFGQADSAVLIEFEPMVSACLCETTGDSPANVTILDLLEFLSLWFVGAPGADVDGTPGVDVLDLLSFLSCWFPATDAGGACL